LSALSAGILLPTWKNLQQGSNDEEQQVNVIFEANPYNTYQVNVIGYHGF
jgi:hypothetical protein